MKLEWQQVTLEVWHGRSDELRFVIEITYSQQFEHYFIDRANYAYKTLRAAKIAASKLAHGFAAEQALSA